MVESMKSKGWLPWEIVKIEDGHGTVVEESHTDYIARVVPERNARAGYEGAKEILHWIECQKTYEELSGNEWLPLRNARSAIKKLKEFIGEW